ncbi:MAG: acyl-CoA dehydrogenase family protein [Ignavibacteria bacterium]|nr:acyl-CoA dehydrogenase family protein [Ignavibacteria bacterium]
MLRRNKRIAINRSGEKRKLVSFALTEPSAGSDVANIKSFVKRNAEGKLVLNGSKIWITNAAIADTIIVFAKCPDLCKIPEGIVFVYLKKEDKGLIIHNPYLKMGIKGSITSELFFDNIELPYDRIIGIPGNGLRQFNALVSAGRLGVLGSYRSL